MPKNDGCKAHRLPDEKVAVPDWTTIPLLVENEFAIMSERRHDAKQELRRIEEEIKQMDEELNSMLLAVSQSSVRVGNLTVKRVDSTSPSKLDKQKLLEAGVAADTIAECTIPGKPYSYVQTVEDKAK